MTTGHSIVKMEPAQCEQHIAQGAKINVVPLHITQAEMCERCAAAAFMQRFNPQ